MAYQGQPRHRLFMTCKREAGSGGLGGTRQTAYRHARRFALEAKGSMLYD